MCIDISTFKTPDTKEISVHICHFKSLPIEPQGYTILPANHITILPALSDI